MKETTAPQAPNHFVAVREWLARTKMSEERTHGVLQKYAEQYEHPFNESNKAFYASVILAIIFYLRYYGVDLEITVFELNLLAIPNSLFVLPLISLVVLSYASVRAADASYYQKIIELIADQCLNDSEKVHARGYFGGGIVSANFIDVWRTIPERGFKFWFVALSSTSGLILTAVALLPFAAGITFLGWVEPIGSERAKLAQQIAMLAGLIAAIIAGAYALTASDLSIQRPDTGEPKI